MPIDDKKDSLSARLRVAGEPTALTIREACGIVIEHLEGMEGAIADSAPSIPEMLVAYEREHVPHTANPDITIYRIRSLLAWWGRGWDSLACINSANCRAYVAHRKDEGIRKAEEREALKARRGNRPANLAAARAAASDGTTGARGDLEVLRAAINYWHREKRPLRVVPTVWLPQTGRSRSVADAFADRAAPLGCKADSRKS